MKKLKVYIDTSVIGGCFDDEFSGYSNKLFEYFSNDIYIPVISDIVIKELEEAPTKVKNKLKSLENLIILSNSDEAINLVEKYFNENILSKYFIDDATHIALATVNKIDVLVSWNFKHIVNLKKINLFNSVNLKEGYNLLEIRSPMEVLNE
jgi:predicted nucleic acid-binding protein